MYVYSDGSLLDSGNVGGGAFVVDKGGEEVEAKCSLGSTATV